MGRLDVTRLLDHLYGDQVNRALFAREWISCGCAVTVLPDGCADVVWTGGELLIVGPATKHAFVPARGDDWNVGVRLRAGAVEAALGVPAHVLRDQDVPVADLGHGKLAEKVTEVLDRGPRAIADVLARELSARAVHPRPDSMVREARRRLLAPGGDVSRVARDLDIGERQLRRRFQRAVGFGPATFRRVERLQGLLRSFRVMPGAGLADLSVAAGYADQPHMNRDVRALAGSTPRELRDAGVRPAGEESGSFKTCDRHRRMIGA